jgi:folate-binding protein YgfZ
MDTIPYSSITVSGDDAFEFLQAQLAADLADLQQQPKPLLAAWCNPKGRVICLFRVTRSEAGFGLALPAELAEPVLRRLTMFRFRSRVDFSIDASMPLQLGVETDYEDWRLANLRSGIPEILSSQSEQFTPHMLNLDLLGAVSVTKGCYPGQEIVARTHFRGATKRRALRFESTAPVAVGDSVSDGDRAIGEVLNAIGHDLLAVVPITSMNQHLTASGHELVNLPLPYFE